MGLNKKLTIVCIVVVSLLFMFAVASPYYDEWKSKPENRGPYVITGTISNSSNVLLEAVNVSISGGEGLISAEAKTDSAGKFRFSIPACVRGEDQYQPISTQPIDSDSVVSISQVYVSKVWMCGNPWELLIKVQKDGYNEASQYVVIEKGQVGADTFFILFNNKEHKNYISEEPPSSADNNTKTARAEFWLSSARAELELYKIDFVREFANEANVSYEKIGTSNGELNLLEQKANLKLGMYWLQSARKEPELYKIDFLLDHMKALNTSLDRFNTTINEIDYLKREAHIRSAEFWLESVRKEPESYKIVLIREHAKAARFSLEKIGTSDNELKSLEKKGSK